MCVKCEAPAPDLRGLGVCSSPTFSVSSHSHKCSQGGCLCTLFVGCTYASHACVHYCNSRINTLLILEFPFFHLLFPLNKISKTWSHDYTCKSNSSFRSCVVFRAFSPFPVAPLFQAAHTPAGQAWGECGWQPGGPGLDPPSLDGGHLPSCFPLSLASSWGPNLSWGHGPLCSAAPMASSLLRPLHTDTPAHV